MRQRMLVAGALIAMGIAGISATPALAAPGWTPPANFVLPAGALAQTVRVGYQAGGRATVSYLQLVSQSPLKTVLHVGVIPPGGSYREQLRIPSTATAVPGAAELAEAPNGAALVEWEALQSPSPSAPLTYLASYRPAGSGSWQPAATIASDTTSESGINGTVVPAISSNGTAAAGIDHVDPTIPSPGGYRIDIAVHPAGGGWSQATQISPPSDSSESLGLAFDAHGNLTAAFRLKMSNGRYTLAAETRPASNGIWSSLQDITGSDPTSDVFVPVLGVSPDGSAVIAFQYQHFAAPMTADVNAVTRAGQNGAWTSPLDVASGGSTSHPLAAGVSPTDQAYVLYSFQGSNSGLDCVGAVRSFFGGTWTNPRCVSPTNFQAGAGGLTFLGNDAYIAFTGQPNGGSSYVVEGSRWLNFGAQPELATNIESPAPSLTFDSLVPDQDGNAIALWSNQNVLRAAAFQSGTLAFTSVGQASRSWRESRRRIKGRKRQPPVGTTFRFTLSEGATVTLKFTEVLPGRRVSRSCVPQTKHNRRKPRCNRSVPVGSLSLVGAQGANRVRFSGRLTHRLAPGSYAVTFSAANGVGQQAAPRTVRFTIVGR